MIDVAPLRVRVAGPVLTPDDDGFEAEVTGWILNYSHTPEVVVGVTSTSDITEAIAFASANGLAVRVQGTGHGAEQEISDGMLIITRRLDDLTIDPTNRLATIGAGLAWARVVEAAAPIGLAPIAGSSTTVGAVGLLLGGGLGPLVRSHGFASDYVRDFEIVTAEGTLRHANANENQDLFWALRGGKGGLGVVTHVTVELVELATLYAGSLTFDEPDIETALTAWVDYLDTVDPRVSTSVAIARIPDFPFIPDHLRGHTVLSVRFAYPGDAETGERLAAPLRAAAPVYVDDLGELPAASIDRIHGDPPNPTVGWARGRMLSRVDQKLVGTILEHAGSGKQFPFVAAEIRYLGPASATDVPEGSAVSGRSAHATLSLVGAPNPTLFEKVVPDAAAALFGAVTPWLDTENNVNFAGVFDSRAEYEAMWPRDIFDRLGTVRSKYDPDGMFVYGVPA